MNRKEQIQRGAALFTKYWKFPEKGYPYQIKWKKYYGPGKLSEIQQYDIIFDERDLRIRKLS